MNLATQVGGIVVVLCAVATLYFQVQGVVAKQRIAEAKAISDKERKDKRAGYAIRTAELGSVIDRVLGLLEGALSNVGNAVDVERRINKVMTELSDAREGDSDAI